MLNGTKIKYNYILQKEWDGWMDGEGELNR